MNKKKFTFNELDSTQFEEFCYDLLKANGYVNVDWRKGTGLNASPSDSGRDIVCELLVNEPDGQKYMEKWFVDCKHYTRGVPAKELMNALAWAEAERPHVLLFIASNYLSNPAKKFIEEYKENNKPKFRIKFWEYNYLKDTTQSKPILLNKYKLLDELNYINVMHPAHLTYIQKLHFNTMSYFFECLDNLDKDKREEIIGSVKDIIIKPRRKKPVTGKETIGELYIDKTDYQTFKQKCYELVSLNVLDHVSITYFLINFILQSLFGFGDISKTEERVREQTESIEFMKEIEKKDEYHKKLVESVRPRWIELLKSLPERINAGYELYLYFCENVLVRLLEEDLKLDFEKFKYDLEEGNS